MSVIDASEVSWGAGTSPSAQEVTVAEGAKAFVATGQTYRNGGVASVALTLGGNDPDYFAYNVGAGGGGGYMAVWMEPEPGTKALSIGFSHAPDSGARTQYASIDEVSDVRDIDALGNASSAGTGRSFNLDTEEDDFVLAYDSRDDSLPSNPEGWTSEYSSGPYMGAVYGRIRSIIATGSSVSVTAQDPNWSSIAGVAFRLNPPTRIQAGFRFYNDDGVEA